MNPIHPNSDPEELAKRLDEALASGQNLSGKPDDARIDLAIRLANAHHPEMSPEMMGRVRSKVLAAHRQQIRRQRTWRPQSTLALRWVAILAVIVICLNAAIFPSLASSVPGEFLYPFKRSLENVEISIAPSLSAKAEVYLTQAQRRIEEAQVLLQRKLFDSRLIMDARSSLALFEQLAPQLPGNTVENVERQAASVNESVAILLQDAEQSQVLSGNQVTALLPTFMPSVESVLPPSLTPSAQPSFTMTPTPSPASVAALPTVEQSQGIEVITSTTEEPAAPVVDTDTPTPSSTPVPTATSTTEPAVTMYAIANANVRSQPGVNQTIITVLQFGKVTEVIGEDDAGKWWHVRLQDGQLGWVAKFLLSVDKPTNSSGSNGGNSASGNNGNSDFGCDHPGNYCNAPGQGEIPPGQGGGKSGDAGGGNPPNSGNGHKS
jgi:Bacterial SH3 domain/Domain of unknown function (DUF5667)